MVSDALILHVAQGFWARFLGWHAYDASQQAKLALWLPHCRAVHTCGLTVPIDILFLDRQGHLLRYCPCVPAWKLRFCWAAASVLESPAGLGLQAYYVFKRYGLDAPADLV